MGYRGTYDKTIFHDPASGYSVISIKSADPGIPAKARSRYRYSDRLLRFTATGHGLPQTDAVELMLEGQWEDTKYGQQLTVEHWEELIPRTKAGVRDYLASGLIKGVGERTAEAIVDKFGTDALDILDNNPERLLEIKGITTGKLEEIMRSYMESRVLRNLMTFLAPYNVTPRTAFKIQQEFGPMSVSTIRTRPYALCRIPGFGFSRVDEIARKTSCRTNDPLRIRGALFYILDESCGRGHLFLTTEELCTEALTLLNEKLEDTETRVQMKEVSAELYDAVTSGELIADSSVIYAPRSFECEDYVAARVAGILSERIGRADVSRELTAAKNRLGITLSPKQEDAIRMAFMYDLSIVTGSPGTGKTTILRGVIDVFQQIRGNDAKILLAAPTGRASRRMAESTGFSNAKTLHSALGLVSSGEEKSFLNKKEPLETDLIIIDEFSMVDMQLAYELFLRLSRGTKVLMVGDADQLPSVGAGNVFREFISCGLVPVTVLTDIFRQSKDSLIAYNAKFINENNSNLYFGNDFVFMSCGTQEETAEKIRDVYLEEAARLGTENVQILSPFRSDGQASVEKLNEVIREMVNPASPDTPEFRAGGRVFRQGDRVMQNKNKNGVSNGDVGVVRSITCASGKDPTVKIEFKDARAFEYDAASLGIIEHAYAMTVHKAMGSEYDTVIIPLLTAHNVLLYRNLIYTAVTRAKRRVILVGQKKALYMAIHRCRIDKRNTMLGQRIIQHYGKPKQLKTG